MSTLYLCRVDKAGTDYQLRRSQDRNTRLMSCIILSSIEREETCIVDSCALLVACKWPGVMPKAVLLPELSAAGFSMSTTWCGPWHAACDATLLCHASSGAGAFGSCYALVHRNVEDKYISLDNTKIGDRNKNCNAHCRVLGLGNLILDPCATFELPLKLEEKCRNAQQRYNM